VTFQTLATGFEIIAPVRECKRVGPSRWPTPAKHNIPVEATKENPYSVDLICGAAAARPVSSKTVGRAAAGRLAGRRQPRSAQRTSVRDESTFEYGPGRRLDGVPLDGVPLIDA